HHAPYGERRQQSNDTFHRHSRLPHQLEHRVETQAALAGERGCLELRAMLIAAAGETDTHFVTAENRVLVLGRRMLLVEDLPLPAAVFRSVAAEIIEECIAAEDAAVIEQHHPGQAALNAVQHAEVDGIEAVDDAPLPDAAGDRNR